jgi:hypothetical protein
MNERKYCRFRGAPNPLKAAMRILSFEERKTLINANDRVKLEPFNNKSV